MISKGYAFEGSVSLDCKLNFYNNGIGRTSDDRNNKFVVNIVVVEETQSRYAVELITTFPVLLRTVVNDINQLVNFSIPEVEVSCDSYYSYVIKFYGIFMDVPFILNDRLKFLNYEDCRK